MQPDYLQQKVRKGRFLVGCAVAAVVMGLAVGGTLLAVVLRFNDVGSLAGQVDDAAREYRKAGLPWEQKDLYRDGPVAPSNNGATLLKKAIADFDSHRFSSENLDISRRLEEGDAKESAVRIAAYSAALDEVVQATEKPQIRIERDWDAWPTIMFPEYSQVRSLSRCLGLRAQVECESGDVHGAVRDLTAASRLGSKIGTDPSLIAMLVQIAAQSTALDSVQRCAYELRNSKTGIAILMSFFDNAGSPPDFVAALRGESYCGLATIRNLKAYGGVAAISSPDSQPINIPSSELKRTGLPADTLSRAFATRHFQAWSRIMDAISNSKSDPLSLGKVLDKIVQQETSKQTVSNILNVLMLPNYAQAGSVVVTLQARTTATKALLTAIQQKQATGKFPSRIDEIKGTWIDPFTGKPMRVRLNGESFRVYSVGPNLKDDGGISRGENATELSKDYDITACFPPIPPRS